MNYLSFCLTHRTMWSNIMSNSGTQLFALNIILIILRVISSYVCHIMININVRNYLNQYYDTDFKNVAQPDRDVPLTNTQNKSI